MSASETNLDKQKRRHWGPLAGISMALILAGSAIFLFSGAAPLAEDAEAAEGTPLATGE